MPIFNTVVSIHLAVFFINNDLTSVSLSILIWLLLLLQMKNLGILLLFTNLSICFFSWLIFLLLFYLVGLLYCFLYNLTFFIHSFLLFFLSFIPTGFLYLFVRFLRCSLLSFLLSSFLSFNYFAPFYDRKLSSPFFFINFVYFFMIGNFFSFLFY